MKYNFDEIIERRGTDSVKWDWAEEGVLPMWVAYMDFKTAPEVIQVISDKVSQGVFGYEQFLRIFISRLSIGGKNTIISP